MIDLKFVRPRKYKHVSRYSIYRQIIDDENNMYTETSNQTPIDNSQYDKYHEVLKEEVGRLDIISNKYYNTPVYFWVIAMANNIIDPFNIHEGEVLRIPNFNSTMNWNGPLFNRV